MLIIDFTEYDDPVMLEIRDVPDIRQCRISIRQYFELSGNIQNPANEIRQFSFNFKF